VSTRVSVLTPPGTGAIASIAVVGPNAWPLLQKLFRRPAGKELPPSPVQNAVWFGTLGDGPGDEVVVAVKQIEPEPLIEIHCHGGRQVVRWVVEQFQSRGCEEIPWHQLKPTKNFDDRARIPLTQASTLRTASILLDQYHGAFVRALEAILTNPTLDGLTELSKRVTVGRHLVTPWRVVIAGPPNVGKSSLINALAGYQRTVVAPIAGTTRDVIHVTVALDGWPVSLADTAGLRAPTDDIEAEGIDRAREALRTAAEIYWVIDAAAGEPVEPPVFERPVERILNKIDTPAPWVADYPSEVLRVSATTGEGIDRLAGRMVQPLNAVKLMPGDAVPFTTELTAAIATAYDMHTAGKHDEARRYLTMLADGATGA